MSVYDVIFTIGSGASAELHVYVKAEFYGDATYAAKCELNLTSWGRDFLKVAHVLTIHRIMD